MAALPVLLLALCAASANAQFLLMGSYNVDSGAPYNSNPMTVSCVQQCAVLYPGMGSYACSTAAGFVNHQAYESCWGVNGCTVFADNAVVNSYYNCGSTNCSCSAFVQDHCMNVNYCFATASTTIQPSTTISGGGVTTGHATTAKLCQAGQWMLVQSQATNSYCYVQPDSYSCQFGSGTNTFTFALEFVGKNTAIACSVAWGNSLVVPIATVTDSNGNTYSSCTVPYGGSAWVTAYDSFNNCAGYGYIDQIKLSCH